MAGKGELSLIEVDGSEKLIRLDWDLYFMGLAYQVSSRSGCHHVRAGSVIVDQKNRIIGTGYNGAAPDFPNHLEIGCRKEAAGKTYENSRNSGLCEGVHAEMNALANLTTNQSGFTLYTTLSPCFSCAKNLAAYKPNKIVFSMFYDEEESKPARDYLERGKIGVEQIKMTPELILMSMLSHPVSNRDVFSKEDRWKLEQVLILLQDFSDSDFPGSV
jgi:dCMP deaminase